ERLFAAFPLLLPTVTTLNAGNIPFAIGGSGCLFVLGNERMPQDVDIFVPDDLHDAADQRFGIVSYPYHSEQEDVRNSNPQQDHTMQLTSHLILHVAGRDYTLSLHPSTLEHAMAATHHGERVVFLPPEDVLLIKALLQRGAEVGKSDVRDIQTFLAIAPGIDRNYLTDRIHARGAEERVAGVLSAGP
ncbi:MAG: hypothetical protein Q7R80_03875, partial [bacterium]|nr:hypothetical protein [bacterium]